VRRSFQEAVAGALSGVAALAFVVAPLLHAEVHVGEERRARLERSAAFERVFDIVFSGKSSGRRVELSRALDRILGGETDAGARHLRGPGEAPHQHGGGPGAPLHSHGPGPHGSGSVQHFAAALHAAPSRISLAQPLLLVCAVAQPREAIFVSRTAWLVEQSQGPPRS
jgi:hypothetical protein